jgi:hypothetical protein
VATRASPTGQSRPRDRLTPAWLLSVPGSKAERAGLENTKLANGVDQNADGLTMAFVAKQSRAAGQANDSSVAIGIVGGGAVVAIEFVA